MGTAPFDTFHKDAPDQHCHIPEGTCLLAYRGSIAHGMYVPNSDPNSIDDVDLMGVVLGTAGNYLGLREWPQPDREGAERLLVDITCAQSREGLREAAPLG